MTEYEYEGTYYLTEGLIYIWWNPKLCDKKNLGADPPKLKLEVARWLKAHPEVKYRHGIEWSFPSAELRQEFKDIFLETRERMEEIIEAGIAAKKAEEVAEWHRQGKLRDSKGRAYIAKTIKGEDYRILVLPDPETGELS